MNTKSITKAITTNIAAVAATFLSTSANGTTKTWIGTSNVFWSNTSNWAEGSIPADGDTLLFPGGTGGTSSNDLTGITLGGITFTGTSGTFTVAGESFTLAEGGTGIKSSSAGAVVISAPFRIAGTQAIDVTTVDKDISFTGEVSGNGALFKIGMGNLKLKTDNRFTGGVTVTNGLLYVYADHGLGAPAAPATIKNSFLSSNRMMSRLSVVGPVSIPNPLYFAGETQNAGTLLMSGNITLGGPIQINGQMRWGGEANATYTVTGGVTRLNNGNSIFINNIDRTSKLVFDGIPLQLANMQIYSDGQGTFVYNQPGNVWRSIMLYNGKHIMGATNALPPASEIMFAASGANGVLDLNGYNQALKNLYDISADMQSGHCITSASPAIITVNSTIAHSLFAGRLTGAASLCWNPTVSTYVFVFSNAVSTSTGSLLISNGTVRVTGKAQFPNLSAAAVASGATLSFSSETALNPEVTIHLAGNSTLELGDGIAFTAREVLVDGTALPPGLYAATASGEASALSQIKGNGTLYIPAPVPTLSSATWDAGGIDTAFSTVENWEDDTLPDFTTGGLIAIFSTNGSLATVTSTVNVKSLRHASQEGGNFTVASDSSTNRIKFFEGGIQIDSSTNGVKNFIVQAPLLLAGNQTWSVEETNAYAATLTLSNRISSLYDCSIVKNGKGRLNLTGNNTFDGNFIISNGAVYAYSDQAFGSNKGITTLDNTALNASIYLCGVTLDDSLSFVARDKTCLYTLDNTTNTVNGAIKVSSNLRFQAGANSLIIFAGGIDASGGLFIPHSSSAAPGIIITNSPFTGQLWTDGAALTVLATTNNYLYGNSPLAGQGVIRTDVDDAFNHSTRFSMGLPYTSGGGMLDLNGHSQTIGNLYAPSNSNSSTVFYYPHILSDKSATLTLVGSAFTTNIAIFSGRVSLEYAGTGTTMLVAPNTTTGGVSVKGGKLVFGPTGSWMNGTNVTVSAGTLQLQHGKVFNKYTILNLSGTGVISLDAGVRQEIMYLYNGATRLPLGTYGATGSGASHIDNIHFTGSGILQVNGNYRGTVIRLM